MHTWDNGAVNPRTVVILGSTGSVGTQALELIGRNRDRFRVLALSAGGDNVALLAEQALEFGVEVVAVAKATVAQDLQLAFYAEAQRKGYAQGEFKIPKIITGPDASSELAAMPCDVVLNAITGSVGLQPTLTALDAGTTLALANKESLVIGGPLVTRRVKPGQIVPVDSEHSAIAQCLRGGTADEVRRLVVTASGGPFRGRTRAEMADVTPAAGDEPPDLGHGSGDHDQLGQPGEQGPRGDRGAPALRAPDEPDRGGGAPAVDRALDGRVRGRLDHRPGLAARHAVADRARARLA